MRTGPTDEVLAGTPLWQCRVSSWLGGTLLAASVPIHSGRVTSKASTDIIEELSITVPRYAAPAEGGDIVDWRPAGSGDALARYGQTLDVSIIVTSVITGDVWETRIGRYQIKDWADDDFGMITVKGESMLARTRDDKLLAPTSPTGTLMSEVRRLLPSGMGVSFDTALVDRACPAAMSWSEDRLSALNEIADAWPALLRIDPWGQAVFKAPLPAVPSPVVTLKDGSRGTLVAAPRSDSRAAIPNVVVATSSASNAQDVQGVAQITSGPMSVNGPYGSVVTKWSSPLITTSAMAQASAQTMLKNLSRPALSVPVQLAPDPRIELDDAVEILRGVGDAELITVPAVTHPSYVEDLSDVGTFIVGS